MSGISNFGISEKLEKILLSSRLACPNINGFEDLESKGFEVKSILGSGNYSLAFLLSRNDGLESVLKTRHISSRSPIEPVEIIKEINFLQRLEDSDMFPEIYAVFPNFLESAKKSGKVSINYLNEWYFNDEIGHKNYEVFLGPSTLVERKTGEPFLNFINQVSKEGYKIDKKYFENLRLPLNVMSEVDLVLPSDYFRNVLVNSNSSSGISCVDINQAIDTKNISLRKKNRMMDDVYRQIDCFERKYSH